MDIVQFNTQCTACGETFLTGRSVYTGWNRLFCSEDCLMHYCETKVDEKVAEDERRVFNEYVEP